MAGGIIARKGQRAMSTWDLNLVMLKLKHSLALEDSRACSLV